jgi:UDP-4-amino-4,6-dideoxy-N-acetyl-beta-L-altrosamine transaminase
VNAGPRPFLPYGRQLIEDDDVAAVTDVLRGDWLTTGPAVDAFERAFAETVGARHAVSCSSGTAALHLATLALGLKPGEAAVVPTLTFLATANAVRYVGAEVVFADVDPDSGLMTPATLETALAHARAGSLEVRAVLPVHMNGQCVDMPSVRSIGDRYGLAVVEDACHVLGGIHGAPGGAGEPVGGCPYSDMATFSLHPVKAIAAGEGGVVTTNRDDLAGAVKRLRNHGMVREPDAFENRDLALAPDGGANPWYYEMPEPGFNYRLSDIHCALARSQLGKLERFVKRRGALVRRYDERLATLSPLVRPIDRVPWCRPAWHLYPVLIDFAAAGLSRADVIKHLASAGIGTQVHYLPVHLQPYYERRYGHQELPGAGAYYDRALSLPLFAAMTDGEVDRVVDTLTAVLTGRKRH